MEQKYQEFYRGEIYYADTSPAFMRETALQPVLVLLTDQGLYNSPTVVVAVARHNSKMPGQAFSVQLESIHPTDKRRLRLRVGKLTDNQMEEIDAALREKFCLTENDYLPVEVGAPETSAGVPEWTSRSRRRGCYIF